MDVGYGAMRLRTLEQAAAWIDKVGVALLFPNGDYIVPSLWEAVAGHSEVQWGVQRDDGKWEFTPETARVWSRKDELPARRLVCVGLHVARTSSLVAPRLLPALRTLAGEPELDGVELELAEAARELGRPATRRELRLLVGTDKRLGDRAINALQRKLVLTNAGLDTEGSGWGATLHDLFERRWKAKLRRVPSPGDAVASLAAAVVRGAGEASAADVAAALRVRRRDATETLERLEAEGSLAALSRDGLRLWTAPNGPGRNRHFRGRHMTR
jgi:hypothetical protein